MSYRFLLRFFVLVYVCVSPRLLWAADNSFVVEAIEVKGGERVSVGTVLNYLPMRVGERYEDRDSAKLIRALFSTGMFNDVTLERDGSTLVVTVVERPAISEIKIEGNEKLEGEQLTASLNSLGIAKGRVFNRSVLERVQQEIRRLYFSQGNYGMQIETTVLPLARNRVDIEVKIQEGEESKIQQINIIGNQRFSDALLLDQIESSESGVLSFFSSADQYSRTKLAGDLEILRSYYQDRGYINFQVTSSQISITPDKQGIYITINIDEGEQYRVREVALAGRFVLPKDELEALLLIEQGDIFSRRQVTNATSKISERLGNDGYAFANIDVLPSIDDDARQVDLKIVIDPGKRVYVRRITFSGNNKTHDNVLRREMRQLEGGWLSPSKVKRSRIRLQRLSYIEQVSLETPKVAGRDDLVDLNVSVTERSSGSFSIGAGYSSTQGLLFNASLSQENLLGTGQRLKIAIDNSVSNEQYSLSFTDPYHTEDGVSRTFSLLSRKTDATQLSTTADYQRDSYRLSLNYGIPVNEFTTVRLGGGLERSDIFSTANSSDEIKAFVGSSGEQRFDGSNLDVSLSYDRRNRTVFAEQGQLHRLSLNWSLPGSDLEFYKLGYDFEYYYPLTDRYVFSVRSEIKYGEGQGSRIDLPFFEKYYAGGIRSVRGYEAYSLGPKDSRGEPAGGDFKTTATLEIIFPPPFVEEPGSTRLSFFIDNGNVFPNTEGFELSELRSSIGVAFLWLSPIGPLSISYGEPINIRSNDTEDKVQFTIGTLF